jgi:hypothetical protein
MKKKSFKIRFSFLRRICFVLREYCPFEHFSTFSALEISRSFLMLLVFFPGSLGRNIVLPLTRSCCTGLRRFELVLHLVCGV